MNMTYDCTHRITKQRFVLQMNSEAQALALQPRLGQINHEQLLPVIERVFDALTPTGQTVRIDHLVLDLGWLALADVEQQLAGRLEQVLRVALQRVLAELSQVDAVNRVDGCRKGLVSSPAEGGNSQVSNALNRLQLLEYYLLNGTLHWSANRQRDFVFEPLFMTATEHAWQQVLGLLSKHQQVSRVIERLVVQCSAKALMQLLQHLVSEQGVLLFEQLSDPAQSMVMAAALSVDANTYRRQLWIMALSEAIKRQGGGFDGQVWLKTWLLGLAQANAQGYEQCLDLLYTALSELALQLDPQPDKRKQASLLLRMVERLYEQATAPASPSTVGQISAGQTEPLSLPVAGPIAVLFGDYDQLEMIRAYLQYGHSLSHQLDCLLGDGETCQAGTDGKGSFEPAALLALSDPLLRIALSYSNHANQQQAMLRLVQCLSPSQLALLLRRVLPVAKTTDDPLRAAIASFAADAAQPQTFYALLLGALLHGQAIDLQGFSEHSADTFEAGSNMAAAADDEHNVQPFEPAACQSRIFTLLLSGTAITVDLSLMNNLNWLFQHQVESLAVFVGDHIKDRAIRQCWAAYLPESVLVRFAWLLQPILSPELIKGGEALMLAWQQLIADSQQPDPGLAQAVQRHRFWSFILNFLATTSPCNGHIEALTRAFFHHFALVYEVVDGEAGGVGVSRGKTEKSAGEAVAITLLNKCQSQAIKSGQKPLVEVLKNQRQLLLLAWQQAPVTEAKPDHIPENKVESKVKSRAILPATNPDCIYIANAGLV
jgi:hypothetical protein